jgi:phospholipid/cholesterol/gamma-HCH transport system substrate-binding protein
VGTVSKVTVSGDGEAADITMVLRGDVRIPKDSYMQVTMATMAGIQSVDIIPESATGPYLTSGDTVSAPADRQPQQMDSLIADAATVLRSIGDGTLATVGDEIYTALGNNEKTLTTLLSNGSQLASLVRRSAPMLRGLLGEWLPVLDAMSENTASFERGMTTAATFTDQLDAQQPVFVYLLDRSPKGLDHARTLFDKYRGTFGGVLANLTVVEPIISDRQPALATGLKTIPRGMKDLRSIVKNGRADFSLIATQGPVCLFDDEPRSSIGDLDVASPDVTRYCPPGNGYAQRGAVNAPRPNDLGTSTWTRPGRASGPPVVDDPVLVPNGAELLDWWRKLEERAKNGN